MASYDPKIMAIYGLCLGFYKPDKIFIRDRFDNPPHVLGCFSGGCFNIPITTYFTFSQFNHEITFKVVICPFLWPMDTSQEIHCPSHNKNVHSVYYKHPYLATLVQSSDFPKHENVFYPGFIEVSHDNSEWLLDG